MLSFIAETAFHEDLRSHPYPCGRFQFVLLLLIVLTYRNRHVEAQVNRRQLPQVADAAITLNSILDRLEVNILDYRQSVPNLYCSERAQADRTTGGEASGPSIATPGGQLPVEHLRGLEVKSKTEATFRLRRTSELGSIGVFEESRILLSVDGKPPISKAQILQAPAMLYGVFSNGLNILSKEGRACFAFRLHESNNKKPFVVDFSDLPQNERGPDCPPFERTKGRITVDRASLHVLHIEKQTPGLELVPGVFGIWEWTEDYAPVTLLQRTFWMPKRIRSRSTATDGAGFVWNFDATYSDYHLFHAESRVVPLEP